MFNRNDLAQRILSNCAVSDAAHAGQFSVCGLALRLRDLYKWEQALAPWEEHDAREVLAWIGEREDGWEHVEQETYAPLQIGSQVFDPFDTAKINARLAKENLFYGAGYAYRLKPTFFLAEIKKQWTLHGHQVLLLGHELARDLLTLPALTQDNCIIVRREAARLFVWDQMTYIKPSGKPAFKWGLNQCGVTEMTRDALQQAFTTILDLQETTYIYHELGEIVDETFDRALWREIIGAFPHSPTELLARAVKDLLADTGPHGPLVHIIEEQNAAALAFYVAFSDGLVKELFPHMKSAFKAFSVTEQWHLVSQAVASGYADAQRHADLITRLFLEGKRKNDLAWTADEIERQLL